MTYAITGASGQLGRLTAELLLERVDPSEVVLLTRDPARLEDLAARGADVRAADFADPATLPAAFAGVDRVLLVSTDAVGARVEGHRAAIDAMVAAGVERVAYTSVFRPESDNPAAVVPDHVATEDHLRASGAKWIMLRNNLYADMQVDVVRRAASSGQLVSNNGAGRVSYVTRADCAAAAVGALLGDAVDVDYDIVGPEPLGSTELAGFASDLAGTPVAVVDVDDAAFIAGLAGAGLPAPVAELLASFGTSARLGFGEGPGSDVRALTGHEPASLRSLLG